jgi:hypothetical protein
VRLLRLHNVGTQHLSVLLFLLTIFAIPCNMKRHMKQLFSSKKATATSKKSQSVEPAQSAPPTSDSVPKKLQSDEPAQTAPSVEPAQMAPSTDTVPKKSQFNKLVQTAASVEDSQTVPSTDTVPKNEQLGPAESMVGISLYL